MKPTIVHENLRILLVDDNNDFRNTLADMIEEQVQKVYHAENGEQGYEIYARMRPDIVVSDIKMAPVDGYELLRKIRETDSQTPVILMSAFYVSGEDIYMAMSLGANDYMRITNFTLHEFIARINNCRNTPMVSFGNCCYNAIEGILFVKDVAYKLTNMQSIIMSLLAYHIGKVVDRKDIHTKTGEHLSIKSRSIDMCINSLRKYLKDDPSIKIETFWRKGYRLRYYF